MKKKPFISKFNHVDLVAIILISGGFILMALHVDTVVGGIVTMVTGYYFGSKIKNQ